MTNTGSGDGKFGDAEETTSHNNSGQYVSAVSNLMFSSTLVLFLDFVVHLNRNLYLRSVTGMPPCLRGAVLEPETHFSFLKINLLPSHPSFQAGSINKGGRNNAHSLNCWKGPSLFSTTIMTELHSCDSPAPV